MKKVLIISHWYYPRNNPRSFRARALADELRAQNIECDVYIGEKNQLVSGSDLDNYYCQETDTSRTGRDSLYKGKGRITRAAMHFFIGEKFIITNIRRAMMTLDKSYYDAVISIGNPFYVHLIAGAMKKKKIAKTVIADCGDPFYMGKPQHFLTVKCIQRWTFNRIDYLAIPIEGAVEYYKDYVPFNRINVIPQGFSTDGITLKEYKENGIVRFAYAGAFYEDIRNPEKLLRYLSGLDVKFQFHIFTTDIGSVYQKVLLKYKAKMGDKLQLRPYMKREDCIKELSGFDFLMNIENTTSRQAPSKLIDYAIAKRPVISIKPDNVDIDQINRFLSRNYRDAAEINIEEYRIENVAKQFIELIG